jgi:hypothetical protein
MQLLCWRLIYIIVQTEHKNLISTKTIGLKYKELIFPKTIPIIPITWPHQNTLTPIWSKD